MRRLLRVGGCALVASLGACGPQLADLEAWDMTLTTTSDCSFTGAGSAQCVDAETLAREKTQGRWLFERGENDGFTLTLTDGRTLAGVSFPDDGYTLTPPTAPCLGEGGLCLFARDRQYSVDANNNNCANSTEHLVLARLFDNEGKRALTTVVTDRAFADEACGTASGTEVVVQGGGKQADEPSLARTAASESP